MSDAVTTQTLVNTEHRQRKILTIVSDGTNGEITLIDVSAVAPNLTSPVCHVKFLEWTSNMASGSKVELKFEAGTDDLAYRIDAEEGGAEKEFPGNGIVDPKSASFTGDLLLVPTDMVNGDVITVEFEATISGNY